LNLARRLSEEDKNIVNDAIIRVGIEALRDKSVELLSGGERQKAYIAMLIAQAADIVFLDEPTTFLDINHKLEVMNIIKELNKKGKTIVMILHDIGEALESSDMVCVMDKGEILCYDTPDRVFESRLIDRVFNVISQKIYVEGIGKHTFLFRNQKPFT
jgi:iron complex transport system ATP-binding protein